MTTNSTDAVVTHGCSSRQIDWKFEDAEPRQERRWQRGLRHVVLSFVAGLAMTLAPLLINDGQYPASRTALTVPALPSLLPGPTAEHVAATKLQGTAEPEPQRVEILIDQLTSARADLESLRTRVTAVVNERAEAQRALEAASISALKHKEMLERERERADALLQELANARDELQAIKARHASAEDEEISGKNLSLFTKGILGAEEDSARPDDQPRSVPLEIQTALAPVDSSRDAQTHIEQLTSSVPVPLPRKTESRSTARPAGVTVARSNENEFEKAGRSIRGSAAARIQLERCPRTLRNCDVRRCDDGWSCRTRTSAGGSAVAGADGFFGSFGTPRQ